MDNLIENIDSYINYLNRVCGLLVSIHFRNDVFNRIHDSLASTILPYNCHTNAYCIMVKNSDHKKCLLNQKNILTRCQSKKAFCHICHAEVQEYIYPICKNDDVVGFIAVSGYRRNNPAQCNILNYDLWKRVLGIEIPLKICNSVIPPLCIMLECALQIYLTESGDEYNQILQFLYEYHTNITLSDLTKHFHRSKSHISHLFKKKNGMTIRAYCNELKLEDAKKFLLKTDIPITEIALNVGFNDTSYFIYLFKKKFGISPLQYRKINIQNDDNLCRNVNNKYSYI